MTLELVAGRDPRPRRRDRPGHRPDRLHPGRRLLRRRLVHLPRHRRPRDRPGGDGHARRHPRAGLRRRGAADGRRCRGVGAAELHGPRRRRPHAVDRRRPGEGLARRDRGRRGHLHAGWRPLRRGLVHVRACDGVADSAPATVAITITRRPSCADVSRAHRGRRGGLGAADLHGRRRRPADPGHRRRAEPRHVGLDLRRRGHVQRRTPGYLRRGFVHVHRYRRHGDLRARDGVDHRDARAQPVPTSRGRRPSTTASRCRSPAPTPTATR